MINSYRKESDLRTELRKDELIGSKLRWIEPSFGSTIGLPDCFLPFGEAGSGKVLWLELKVGWRQRKKSKVFFDGRMVDCLEYSVRRPQRIEIMRMREEGLKVGFIVAELGTKRAWAVQGEAAIDNYCELEGPQGWAKQVPLFDDGKKDWRKGFNWIFFDDLR